MANPNPSNNGSERFVVDRTGQRYGKLVVIERAPKHMAIRGALWLCQCDCGGLVVVPGGLLGYGRAKSCGRVQHVGEGRRSHGRTSSSEYNIWSGMLARCYNPKSHAYHLYGGRGIQMTSEWRDSFEAFYADMGPRPSPKHSIERVDNDAGYSAANCIWATADVQAKNRRCNLKITHVGKTQCLADWAKELNVNEDRLRARFNATGRDLEKALASEEAKSFGPYKARRKKIAAN